MLSDSDKLYFHIDVNSAYLSWTAAKLLQLGISDLDIRKVPSIICGDPINRQGIVLAKSIPCKKFNIQTGETIYNALKKYPKLLMYPPDYDLYMKCSNAMYEILKEYTPLIERYSVDENFLDMTHFKDEYMSKAIEIKNRIEFELGFTVNIGISSRKLLSKMASDFEKPNKIHTLFPSEVEAKMWPLPVDELFMVGRATKPKLQSLGINTIGELAKYDKSIIKSKLKSFGNMIHEYANGIDNSVVRSESYLDIKGIGNSTTTKMDICTREEAKQVILSLVETTSMRLRKNKKMGLVVAVSIKTNTFLKYSHQRTLNNYTDCTDEIYKEILKAFDEVWKNEKIRHIGVRVTNLCSNQYYQSSLFDDNNIEKKRALDKTIDELRGKFGNTSVIRSTFLNSDVKPLLGGVGEEDYLMMNSRI